MSDQHVGPIALPGVNFESWLLKFDKIGACISPRTRQALLQRLQAIGNRPVILFSHGWNNEFDDAAGRYASFMRQLGEHIKTHPLPGEPPLFVGVIWPSTWFSWDTGPAIAAGEADGPLQAAEQAARTEIADGLSDPASRERLYALLDSPALTEEEAEVLAKLVATSLAASVKWQSQEGTEAQAPDSDSVLAAFKTMQDRTTPTDGAVLEEGGTLDAPEPATLQSAGLLSALDPRPILRLASVYQMKDRAGTVGWNGIARLVEDILKNATGPLHVVGHSYGCKVVLSAITGAAMPRKVRSVLLLQPAISHLSFAATVPGREGSGGYSGVPAKVERTILTTYSGFDRPLHDVFHLALRRKGDLGELMIAGGPTSAGSPPSDYAALGGYGPRGAGEILREPLPDPGQDLLLPEVPAIIGLDGTQGRRIGSHGDVTTPSTAWLLHQQMAR
jgi:hypothetical protein